MPNRESKSKVMRMIDLKVYDSDGKLVPETPHGRRIHGRDQMVFPTVVSFSIKPGKSTHEEADLTEEFDLGKPGKYKVQAEQHDPDTRVLVKSNIISVTLVQ